MTGSYTNRQGVKVYTTEVKVEQAEFAESKREESSKPAQRDIGDGLIQVPDNVDDYGLPFN
jgi:single-strand DNA-binding protein